MANCAVKTSIPMLHWSENKELLRWAVYTKCGKSIYIDKVRGSKCPLEIPCCGLYPLDPNSVNYSLKEIVEVSNPIPSAQETPVECNLDMTNKQVPEVIETQSIEKFVWPDVSELTRLVNSQSMRSLSKQLNVSTGNIKKQCQKLGIEIPKARFNWSKI